MADAPIGDGPSIPAGSPVPGDADLLAHDPGRWSDYGLLAVLVLIVLVAALTAISSQWPNVLDNVQARLTP